VTAGAAALQHVSTHEELLELTGGSAFLRWDIPAPLRAPAHRLGSAFALPRQSHTRRRGLLVMGPPDDVDSLLATATASGALPPDLASVTVQRGSLEAVARHLPLDAGNEWEWLCTFTPPPTAAAEHRVRALARDDEADIRELLDVANPGTEPDPSSTRTSTGSGSTTTVPSWRAASANPTSPGTRCWPASRCTSAPGVPASDSP
jgi:hypothetical protein